MKSAFRIGILPRDFWDLTPHELKLCVETSNDRELDNRARDMWMAWHTAFMHRVDVKHFPDLNDLIKKLRPAAKAEKPAPSSVGRDLMNALLQLPAAPPPPKPDTVGGRRAFDASDQPPPKPEISLPPSVC